MPVYTYRCESCGVQFEKTQKFSDQPLTRCPECGKKGVKQWYVTAHGLYRDCQYCQHTWGELSWKIAITSRTEGVSTQGVR